MCRSELGFCVRVLGAVLERNKVYVKSLFCGGEGTIIISDPPTGPPVSNLDPVLPI